MSLYGDRTLHGPDFDPASSDAASRTLVMRPYRPHSLAIYGIAFDFHPSARRIAELHQLLGSLAEDISRQSTDMANETRFHVLNDWKNHVWRAVETLFESESAYRTCGVRASTDLDEIHSLSDLEIEQHEVMRGPHHAMMIFIETTGTGRHRQSGYRLMGHFDSATTTALVEEIDRHLSLEEDIHNRITRLWRRKGEPHATDWYGRHVANITRQVCRELATHTPSPSVASKLSNIRPVVVSKELHDFSQYFITNAPGTMTIEEIDHTASSAGGSSA